MTTTLAALLVLLFLPLVFLFWLTESKQQKAKRWRNTGTTYRVIAERLHVSQTTARKYVLS